MKLAYAALALVSTCAANNPILSAAKADLEAKIKAIDEATFFTRIRSFVQRRSLSHSIAGINSVTNSMSNMYMSITNEEITSATQVIDTLQGEYCVGTGANMTTVGYISAYITEGLGSLEPYVGLTNAQIGYDGLISNFLSGCLCTTTWKLDQPEVTELWATVVAIVKNSGSTTNAEKRADLIAKIKAAAPILSGPTSVCADSCKASMVAIFDSILALVPQITLSDDVSESGSSLLGKWGPTPAGNPKKITLPADSMAQAKLGTDLYGCLCTGWDWGAVAEAAFGFPWYMVTHSSSPTYGAWGGIAEGTIAAGSPWLTKSQADQAKELNEKYPDYYDFPTTSDPPLVLDSATTNLAIIRSSLCATSCLTFFTDFVTVGLQTAAQYYWPSLITGLLGDKATVKQIPTEANITAAMNKLPNCMCNMNLTEAKDTLYPHLSYLLTGEDSPHPSTQAMLSTLAYSGAPKAFCTVSDCSGFLGSFLKLFTPAAELILTTPGAILEGDYFIGSGVSLADPPMISPGTLTVAQMNTLADNLMPCMCKHVDPATGAIDMVTWAETAIINNASFSSGMQPNAAKALQPFIMQAMQGSKYCGANSCRAVVQVLKEHVASMQPEDEEAGTCTAANAATCKAGGTGGEVCGAPKFGPKASQKFPLRWLDMETAGASSEYLSLNDTFVYWELCAAVMECPLGGADFFEVKVTFTVDATVETFDKSAFKEKLAEFLNKEGGTAGSVTPKDITLKVAAGSITVECSIKSYTESVQSALVDSLEAATPESLGSALGVDVLSKSEVTTAAFVTNPDGSTQEASVGGSGDPVVIIIVVLAVVFLILLALGAFCFTKKKQMKPKEPVAVTMTAHEMDNKA